jgi:diguanylate cyclase (GGDEF)-like protein
MNFSTQNTTSTIDELLARIQQLEAEKCKLQWDNQRLKQLVNIDQLTGVSNRCSFDVTLQREWRRAARQGEPLALLMLDLDYFKRYNDTYGHRAGDQLLQQTAQALQAILRRSGDQLFRYGGEEFACILPNTPVYGINKVANLLLQAVRECGATLSIGSAIMIPDLIVTTPHQLVEAADKALYQAKREGRDRFCIWQPRMALVSA